MSWGKRHFVIRTVRKGQIRYAKRTFAVSELHQKYDGRLDGLPYAFGLYYHGPDGSLSPFVCLWGTVEQYRHEGLEGEFPPPGPELVDGGLPWMWWNQVDPPLAAESLRR